MVIFSELCQPRWLTSSVWDHIGHTINICWKFNWSHSKTQIVVRPGLKDRHRFHMSILCCSASKFVRHSYQLLATIIILIMIIIIILLLLLLLRHQRDIHCCWEGFNRGVLSEGFASIMKPMITEWSTRICVFFNISDNNSPDQPY